MSRTTGTKGNSEEFTSNYDKMSADASRIFLSYNQDELLRRWPLAHDEGHIYVRFIDKTYRIDRKTGKIYQPDSDTLAGFDVTLSILDMICNSPQAPHAVGEWLTLQQMTNAAGAGPVNMDMYVHRSKNFAGHPDALAAACESLGGSAVKGGEVSYQIPIFDDFPIWFQFWDADDEFPMSISILWDKTTPQHLKYETLWYVMGEVIDRLNAYVKENLNA